MLIKRIISSIIVLAISGLVIFYLPNWTYMLVVVVFTALGVSEFLNMMEKKGVFVYRYFGVITGCLIPISVYLNLGENYVDMETFLIVLACLFTFILQMVRRENSQDHFISIAVTLLALFYISWFFSFFIKLKFLPNGPLLVTYLILVTKFGDVSAYFGGRAFGKRKLIPRISPNKTIEGTMLGLLGSVAASVAAGQILGMPVANRFLLGLFLGVVGQTGDLAESLVKRDCQVKDSGGAVPGFGGMLDLIDSLLFTAPIFYFYAKMFMK